MFRKFDLNFGQVLIFTVIHFTACSLNIHTHIRTSTRTWWIVSCWNYHDLSSCRCLTCMCLKVSLQAFVCVRRCRLSPSSGPTSRWITRCNRRKQEERGGRGSSFPFLPFLFIFFDSSLDISLTCFFFLKLHNTLLEVWVEGRGGQRREVRTLI